MAAAVFSTKPASMSAWETAYVEVHVAFAPGAMTRVSQTNGLRPAMRSSMVTSLRVTLPSLTTTNVYVTISPAL